MHITNTLLWLLLLNFTLLIYCYQDGTALGLGMLLPFISEKKQTRVFQYLIPNWDMNQTWLVVTLAGLYAGFSNGFALLLSFFYLKFIALLLALMCRGAAIEYCQKSHYATVFLRLLAGFSSAVIGLQALLVVSMITALGALPYLWQRSLTFILLVCYLSCFNLMLAFSRLKKLSSMIKISLLTSLASFMFAIEHHFYVILFPAQQDIYHLTSNQNSLKILIEITCVLLPVLSIMQYTLARLKAEKLEINNY